MKDIVCLEAFNDNYIWLLVGQNGATIVVDPGDATPVLQYLKKHHLNLKAIFVTHHHFDHCGAFKNLATAARK